MLSASGDVLKIYRNIIFYAYYEYAVSLRVHIFRDITFFPENLVFSHCHSFLHLFIYRLFIQSFIFICSSYLFFYLYYDIYLFIYQYVLT
jgi:hypothetical protein